MKANTNYSATNKGSKSHQQKGNNVSFTCFLRALDLEGRTTNSHFQNNTAFFWFQSLRNVPFLSNEEHSVSFSARKETVTVSESKLRRAWHTNNTIDIVFLFDDGVLFISTIRWCIKRSSFVLSGHSGVLPWCFQFSVRYRNRQIWLRGETERAKYPSSYPHYLNPSCPHFFNDGRFEVQLERHMERGLSASLAW